MAAKKKAAKSTKSKKKATAKASAKSSSAKKSAAKKKSAARKPAAKKAASKKKAAPKKSDAKKAAAPTKKSPAKTAKPAKKSAPKKAAAAPTAPKEIAKSQPVSPAPQPPRERPPGSVSSMDVSLGHVFSIKPRINTSFKKDDFNQAKRALKDEVYEDLRAAVRAVAEEALSLTRGSAGKPQFHKKR